MLHPPLERQLVVADEIGTLAEDCLCLSGRFSGCGRKSLLSVVISLVAELYGIGNNLRHVSLGAVLRVVGARLQRSFHSDLASLGQILRGEFGGLPPTDHVEKVAFALAGLLVCKPAGNGQPQRALCNATLGCTGFRIGADIADQDNAIDKASPLFFV